MFAYWLARAVSFVVCLLPRSVADKFGLWLGNIAWYAVPKRRKILAAGNIKRCLSADDAEAERIARASTVRFGPMLFEVLRFGKIKGHIDEYVTFTGLEHLREAMKNGQGGIIATCHSGNWELMGGALAQAGIPIVGVAMKQKSAGSDRFINEQRRLIGMHITYKTDVREMYDMLAKGWFIGLIMDQDTSMRDGILLDFFGQLTNCVTGAASMARFKKVPIFPGFMHRLPNGTHHLIIREPIEQQRSADKRADIKHNTQIITTLIEEHIRAYPEEWFWLHDRWKSMREEYKIGQNPE